jgi:selenocysteine lyase/cysteine desulfurase
MIVALELPEPERAMARLKEAGVDVSLRADRVRVSPHFYNTEAEIDRLLEVLRAAPMAPA